MHRATWSEGAMPHGTLLTAEDVAVGLEATLVGLAHASIAPVARLVIAQGSAALLSQDPCLELCIQRRGHMLGQLEAV